MAREKASLCGAFSKPSDGLEPSTPSLPWALRGNWWQPDAAVCRTFGFRESKRIAAGCHRLRPLGSINAPYHRGGHPESRHERRACVGGGTVVEHRHRLSTFIAGRATALDGRPAGELHARRCRRSSTRATPRGRGAGRRWARRRRTRAALHSPRLLHRRRSRSHCSQRRPLSGSRNRRPMRFSGSVSMKIYDVIDRVMLVGLRLFRTLGRVLERCGGDA